MPLQDFVGVFDLFEQEGAPARVGMDFPEQLPPPRAQLLGRKWLLVSG